MDESTMIPEDGWRDLSTMPEDNMRFLLIEGYCQVSWMEQKIASVFTSGNPGHSTFRVWVTDPSYLDSSSEAGRRPDAFGMDRCIQEIESGVYHGIVVVDYSNAAEFPEFEAQLGGHLQRFVHAGGVLAFPSSEGQLVSTLKKLFDTTWQISNYYRTTWGPCSENERNVNYSFGNGDYARRIIRPYSAKSVSLRNVPPSERCFGVTTESRTQSLVPMMDGLTDIAKPGYATSAAATPEELDLDYDVVVAMHNYGKGCVAYLGDVNCETETVELLLAFCHSRCPPKAIDCFAGIDPDGFAAILDQKDKGNAAFKDGNLQGAISFYNAAIKGYGLSKGSHGSQRDTLMTLHSNMALVHFRTKSWIESETCATRALELDDYHNKALYRRAAARYESSLSSEKGDLSLLKGAKSDVTKTEPLNGSHATSLKLLTKIEHEMKRLQKMQHGKFLDGFAGALS
jgi:hypothetical protein